MKIQILIITIIFIFSATQAQVIDKQAEKILEQVSNKMQSLKTMKIEFSYIMENKEENIKETEKGTIYIEGNKYRLHIAQQIIISDGKTIWTYFKDANEVQINDADTNDENTPLNMLTTYNKNYRPKLIREVPKSGRIIQIIDLTPNKSQSFYKIRLEIDKSVNMIVNSAIYDKSGTIFIYTIDKFTENPNIDSSQFTFKRADFPGVVVTDMR